MLTLLPLLGNRVRSDFLMRSRLDEYRRLLESTLLAGFRITSVGGLWRSIEARGLDPTEHYLVLRHDIDTDWRTGASMWGIERALGIRSSYFFRLSTIAPDLMADIAEGGGEVSYHYEELSAIAKRRGLGLSADALGHLPEAREEFAMNIGHLRALTGLPMRVVAAHGDFVNRRLGVTNSVVLEDPTFRRHVGVDLETYDPGYVRHITSRHADAPYPRYWEPTDPGAAIQAREPVIQILVHPRHWRADRVVNAHDDLNRLVEGLRFEVSARRRRRV